MKKISFIIMIAFCASCTSKTNNRTNLDSLSVDKPTNIAVDQDSISKVKLYGNALKVAYGKAIFGMSEREYKKAVPSSEVIISGTRFYISPIYTNNSKKLIGVDLETSSETANYVDASLQDDMDKLTAVIIKKYGQPDFDKGKPEFFRFKPGYIQWVRKWTIANKLIFIGMAEESSGSKYSVNCQILDKRLNDQNEIVEEKSKELQDSSATENF